MKTIVAIVLAAALSTTFSWAAENSTATQITYRSVYAMITVPSQMPNLSFATRAGSCSSKNCPNGDSSNDCLGSATCSCWCDGTGTAVCSECK